MNEPNGLDPVVVDAINQAQLATLSPQVVLTSGAGKAYQLTAQAGALAIQDAVDALRHTSSIATTASGAALARFLATGDEKYLKAIDQAQLMLKNAVEHFVAVSAAASGSVKGFPAG